MAEKEAYTFKEDPLLFRDLNEWYAAAAAVRNLACQQNSNGDENQGREDIKDNRKGVCCFFIPKGC